LEHAGARIEAVEFDGEAPFPRDTLLTLIGSLPSRCSFLGIPVCVPFTRLGRQEHRLSPEQVRVDVVSLARFYRAAGYFGTRVSPEVEAHGEEVELRFAIQRGDPIILDLLDVEGVDGILDPDSLEERLPLRPGAIFDLGRFAAAWEQVHRALADRGHAYAEVLRNFSVDTIDNSAVATLVAVPGPRVVVDSIVVLGAEHLGHQAAFPTRSAPATCCALCARGKPAQPVRPGAGADRGGRSGPRFAAGGAE
jgi:outer membrane protein assembly factor BamA